jgi:chorismate mutase/prephenate dehydratase
MCLNHRPGALTDVLMKFAALGVNLTNLESRPVPGSDFEFRFIFDFEASLGDPRIINLLSGFAIDPEIEHFTFLGAYSER